MLTPEINSVCDFITARTEAVQNAYNQILIHIKECVKTLENPRLRTFFDIENINDFVHQFFSTIAFIKLSADRQKIHFAIDLELNEYLGMDEYIKLHRMIFRVTMKEYTAIDIEDCLEEYPFWYSEFEEALLYPNAIITIEDPN